MARSHPLRQTLLILAIAVGLAGLACVPPDDPYQRWRLLDGTIHANARWIYERIHFDPTSIDVIVVGPSRTGQGVNAPRLGEALARRGLPAHVVNFSLPEAGRNINDVVIEEALTTKTPKLIIIGVTEKPSRFGHSAFKYIAPAGMILAPGYWSDINYLPDLIYLPYRQLRLLAARAPAALGGADKAFDRAAYRGATIDTTGSVTLPDGSIKEGERPASAWELARGVRKLEAGNHEPILGPALADVEFGDERHYVRRIAEIARAKGAKLMFLFLPYYTGPGQIQEQAFYEQFGPVLNAGFLARRADWYADYGHLTRAGAEHLTDWLVQPVAASLSAPDVPPR
jgi:hypothetical protein